jgi:uncharacterized protein YndB with AHSA1/START domain
MQSLIGSCEVELFFCFCSLGQGFPLEMLITVKFEEHDGETRLSLRHSGIYGPSAQDRDNKQQGWSQSFDKLAEHLEKENSL